MPAAGGDIERPAALSCRDAGDDFGDVVGVGEDVGLAVAGALAVELFLGGALDVVEVRHTWRDALRRVRLRIAATTERGPPNDVSYPVTEKLTFFDDLHDRRGDEFLPGGVA